MSREQNQGLIFLDQPASAIWASSSASAWFPALPLLGACYIWYPLRGDYLRKVQGKCSSSMLKGASWHREVPCMF